MCVCVFVFVCVCVCVCMCVRVCEYGCVCEGRAMGVERLVSGSVVEARRRSRQ